MTDLEAMEKRISRRSYLGPLEPGIAGDIRALAETLNTEHRLSISLVEDDPAVFGGFSKNYGMFSGVHSALVLAGTREDEHLYEKAGHAGEQLVLLATTLGQGSCWVGGTFDRAAAEALLAVDETLVAVIAMGPVSDEPGAKEKLVRRMTHLGGEKANWQATETPPEWFLAGCRAAALAPSAMNKRPVRFGFKNGTARVAIPSGAPRRQHVDLGIAKLHFELAAGGLFPLGSPSVFERE